MTNTQLQELLGQKFNVVKCVDIAELSASPGAALRFFKSVYQSAYDSSSRIVLYTTQEVDPTLVAHLYKTANFVDISNWFILLCTSTDMTTTLAEVCATASTDTVPFQNLVIDIDSSQPILSNFNLPDSICAVPWTNLEIQSDGTITPCCISTCKVGHISTTTLNDAFRNNVMQQLRQDFVDGKKPASCNICWKSEAQGLTSGRLNNQKRLNEKFLLEFFETPTIATLDLKFQNTCNFKCRICGPDASSLYADEQRKFLSIHVPKSLKWSDTDEFIEQFKELLPQLVNIDMYGGEPFLIKKFARVLEYAVKIGSAQNIRLHYNSNGSIWPEEFIKYWPHFKQVDIHFSIDAVGSRFELERGGSWESVESNILRIKDLRLPNMNISVMPTVNIMNVLYIDEVVNWARAHNFPIFVNYVSKPIEFSISNLTQAAKDLIFQKHKDSVWPEMANILNSIQSTAASDGHFFCKKTQLFDNMRGENFADSHPEIANAMGYVYNSRV